MTAARGDAPTLQLASVVPIGTWSKALRDRAVALRDSAETMPPALARAYRRRAAELEFEAWLTDLRRGGTGAAA